MRKTVLFGLVFAGFFVLTSVNLSGMRIDTDKMSPAVQAALGNAGAGSVMAKAAETEPSASVPLPSGTPQATQTPAPSPVPTPAPTPTPIPEPMPYTMAWLDKYAPASVASLEEQVGDNGDYEPVAQYLPADTYKLVVDYHNQCVYAFAKDDAGDFKVLVRVMICTTGGNGNWTPEGTYKLGGSRVRFGYFTDYNCYAQYWSQMTGSFYFHSLLYSARDAKYYSKSAYKNLGKAGSHGCIRLLVPDARWIYECCAPGTLCIVTTEYPKNQKLKDALRKGYAGAVDYIGPAVAEE